MQTSSFRCKSSDKVRCWLCHQPINDEMCISETTTTQNAIEIILISHIGCAMDATEE